MYVSGLARAFAAAPYIAITRTITLYNPRLHKLLDVEAEKGILQYLSGDTISKG